MKSYRNKTGVTLVEILIVVAVIAILTTMVVGIATRISNQSKEQLTKNTFALLNAALGQFRDYGYNYKVSTTAGPPERDFYRSLDFPLDCNGFDVVAAPPILSLQETLCNALGLAPGSVSISGGVHDDPNYSGSEALYFFLSRVPASRQTLDKIDESLITNEGFGKQPMNITIGVKMYPLLRIIDPWGTTLHYDYYNELIPDPKMKRNFPLITSAGPDRIFRTGDDITSR